MLHCSKSRLASYVLVYRPLARWRN